MVLYNIALPVSVLFFTTFLAIFVLFNNRKNIANKFFALETMGASFWILSNFIADISEDNNTLLFWTRSALAGATLVAFSVYFFSLYFPKEKPVKKIYRYIVLFFGLIIIILSPTAWNVESVYRSGGGYVMNTGFLYLPFLFYFALTITFSIFNFLNRAENNLEKIQVKFVIIGIVISATCGVIIDAILPVLGNSQYVSFGPYFIVFFLLFTFYAIIKHHLFSIRVIATELFTLALWITLLVKVFLSEDLRNFSVNMGIFAAVVAIGIVLVKSVIKEVDQKEKIEKMAEDVKRAYEVEKRANEELKNLDRFKNQFLTQAQHDLRTPLSIIRGYCDLLIDGTFGKQPKKTTEIIKKIEAVTVGKINDVNNFLNVSQFQLGKKVISLKPGVGLGSILEEIFSVLSSSAKSKGIYLKLEKPVGEIFVEADREKLKGALFNVIDNSIKYTIKGGVRVKIESSDFIKIAVFDTGIGIPREKIKTLFEKPFERGEQAKKTFSSGMGVGLYLSSQIITAHNGKIWAESEGEGKGSAFYIELPIGNK